MSYNKDEEREQKSKTLKNYWAFAYAQYCIEQKLQMDKMTQNAYEQFKDIFAGKVQPEDKNPKRIKLAAIILKAADEVNEKLSSVENVREETRESLKEQQKNNPDKFAETIRNNINMACEAYFKEKDKAKIAAFGAIVQEHLDAMSKDPKLSAQVNLTEEQMTMAAKIVTVGAIIEDGMKCLEDELVDCTRQKPQITEEQHRANMTKILAMEVVEKDRLSGDIFEHIEKNQHICDTKNEDPLEFGARLSNATERKTMSMAVMKSYKSPVVLESVPIVNSGK